MMPDGFQNSDDRQSRRGYSLIGAVVGFAVGAFFGSSIGIAGFGSAMAGTLPVGIIGAYFGFIHGAWVINTVGSSIRDVSKRVPKQPSASGYAETRMGGHEPRDPRLTVPTKFGSTFVIISAILAAIFASLLASASLPAFVILLGIILLCAKLLHRYDPLHWKSPQRNSNRTGHNKE